MKHLFAFCLAFALTLPWMSAATAGSNAGKDILFNGTMEADTGYGEDSWCSVTPGGSTFEVGSERKHFITFRRVSYNSDAQYMSLLGLARMKFETETAGEMRFDFGTNTKFADRVVPFTKFREVYSDGPERLKLSFKLHIKDCTVKVKATYRD